MGPASAQPSTRCYRCLKPEVSKSNYLVALGEVICDGCLQYKMVLIQDVVQVLERDGGFTPERREALMHLAELAVYDSEKVLRYNKFTRNEQVSGSSPLVGSFILPRFPRELGDRVASAKNT